jgi:O-antigen ligase
MLFILALFISLIFSQDKIMSIKELYKYITGISLFLVGASLAHKDRRQIISCMVISGLLIGILAVYQYFFGFQRLLGYISRQGITDFFVLDYVSRKRVFFPFVTPNALGGYLAMIIPLTLNYKNRAWLIIPLSFALLLTRSVGALLSLFLGLIIYFYLLGRLEKRRIILLLGLLIITAVVLIVRSSTQKQHIQPIFSTIMRINYWKDTLSIIKAYPLTGVGLGNFNLIQSRYAHNSYLQIWAEMGLAGIASIVWLTAAVFKEAIIGIKKTVNNLRPASLISAGSIFLMHNFVDFTFFLPEIAIIWWVILGLMTPENNNIKLSGYKTSLPEM